MCFPSHGYTLSDCYIYSGCDVPRIDAGRVYILGIPSHTPSRSALDDASLLPVSSPCTPPSLVENLHIIFTTNFVLSTVAAPLPVSVLSLMALLLLNDDVQARVYHFCSLPTLSRFRGCSRATDAVVAAEVAHRYTSVLAPFFSDQAGFMRELDTTLSVIGGSAALSIVAGGWSRVPGDLNVYAPKTTFFHILAYLVHVENYSTVSFADNYDVNGAARVVRLRKNNSTIDLVQSRSGTATVPVRVA